MLKIKTERPLLTFILSAEGKVRRTSIKEFQRACLTMSTQRQRELLALECRVDHSLNRRSVIILNKDNLSLLEREVNHSISRIDPPDSCTQSIRGIP